MASIGPSMPAHLSKRKRTPDDNGDGPSPPKQARNADEIDLDSDGSDDDYGPAAPSTKPAAGPTLPPAAPSRTNNDEIDLDDSDSDSYGPSAPAAAPAAAPASKPSIGPSMPPKRTIGPSMPPPEASATTAADSDSDSDSDYGPAPPSADPSAPQTSVFDRPSSQPASDAPAPSRRDDWMLAPPTSSGFNERDPSKLKARRFASNKPHASAPSGGGTSEISSIWTETPEQKRKRLEDAVLGRAAPAGSDLEAAERMNPAARAKEKEEEARRRRTAEHVAATRGKSLYEEHQSGRKQGRSEGKDVEEEDDPSKRAFDREKDMGLGGQISTAQRRELMTKAKDFGGRFQKGSFL